MRRWIYRSILLLTTGFVFTIAACWAPMFYVYKQQYNTIYVKTDTWVFDVPATWPPSPDSGVIQSDSRFVSFRQQGNRLYSLDHEYVVGELRSGWPLKAMTARFAHYYSTRGLVVNRENIGTLARGISVSGSDHTWLPRLPLLPRPFPFLVNTFVYAITSGVVWLSATHALQQTRSWLRIRRGLCRKCGYDLTGLETCPECGTYAKPRRMQA